MEFHEKLQELRKQNEMTQEELAKVLYVSRTAISKWESGRGYPNIESLKAIAGFFKVSLVELLSSGEILVIAEEDHKQRERHYKNLVFGLLDVCVLLFFFLPFFGQRDGDTVEAVSLLSLSVVEAYLKIPYLLISLGIVLWGIFMLAFQTCQNTVWLKYKEKVSITLSTLGVVIFIISQQPYAAVLSFAFLVIKAIMLIKWA